MCNTWTNFVNELRFVYIWSHLGKELRFYVQYLDTLYEGTETLCAILGHTL
jgi:hypothetical protein